MTTKEMKDFVADNDFGYAETTGIFGCIDTPQDREEILNLLDRCNQPEELTGEELEDVLRRHPEFRDEIFNGCTIYACEEYEGANRVNTHYIAYYPAEAFAFAYNRNAEVAELADEQLYLSRAGRELREAAKEAVYSPIIATAPQIRERYGAWLEKSVIGINLDAVADHKPEDKFVWAFMADKGASRKYNISIAPITKIGGK